MSVCLSVCSFVSDYYLSWGNTPDSDFGEFFTLLVTACRAPITGYDAFGHYRTGYVAGSSHHVLLSYWVDQIHIICRCSYIKHVKEERCHHVLLSCSRLCTTGYRAG
jgi:hypothetical protein